MQSIRASLSPRVLQIGHKMVNVYHDAHPDMFEATCCQRSTRRVRVNIDTIQKSCWETAHGNELKASRLRKPFPPTDNAATPHPTNPTRPDRSQSHDHCHRACQNRCTVFVMAIVTVMVGLVTVTATVTVTIMVVVIVYYHGHGHWQNHMGRSGVVRVLVVVFCAAVAPVCCMQVPGVTVASSLPS